MVCHILCPECGEDLNEVCSFIDIVKKYHIKDEMDKSKKNISIDMLDLNPNLISGIGYIFEAVNLNNQCCRVHIMGKTDFDSVYI